jgi:uncharacterized RDD family membrane protein YckC
VLRQPWRRLAAWLVDWLVISVWVGALFAIGIPLASSGALAGLSTLGLNLFSFAVLVVPVTVFLAVLESRGSTLGKRALRLRVGDAAASGRVPLARTLLRNALKIALPWAIGHAAVYGFATLGESDTPAWLIALTAGAYVLPVLFVASLFVRSGRTPYDFAARTLVIHQPTKE